MIDELRNDVDTIYGVFSAMIAMIADENVQKMVTHEQRLAVLDALGFTAEEVSEDHIVVGVLFVTLDIDVSNPASPSMKIGIDVSKMNK